MNETWEEELDRMRKRICKCGHAEIYHGEHKRPKFCIANFPTLDCECTEPDYS